MRVRKVAKYGNTDIIRLKPKDKEDMGWEYGDEVDIDGCEKVETRVKDKHFEIKQRRDKLQIEEKSSLLP